jgi:hypothetical protein
MATDSRNVLTRLLYPGLPKRATWPLKFPRKDISPVKYHLAHVIPDPLLHGLNGYKEVIETVRWGIEQLGHEVSYAVNDFAADGPNIVFGGQMIPPAEQAKLRADTIFYNFEQLRGLEDRFPASIHAYGQRFEVWDYSDFNQPTWAAVGTKYPVRIVPVGYAPLLEQIAPAPRQDIDALIYGLTNELRLNAFHALCMSGISTVFVCGLYGADRDGLIARAKTVVNVSLYDRAKIFEIVRASYLFANRKAVVAHAGPETGIEDDIREAFAATDARNLVATVHQLVRDDAVRHTLEEKAHEVMVRRDIRTILREALA